MKKLSKIIVSTLLIMSIIAAPELTGMQEFIPSMTISASAASSISESTLNGYQKDWNAHDWVLKQNYRYNSTSTGKKCVKDLQSMLNLVMNEKLSVDGVFGSETNRVTKAFQKKYGLTVDGVVGNGTWNKLMSVARSKTVKTVPKITISASFPSKITYGKSQNILGTISSTDYISSIKAVVTNGRSNALPPVEVKPNARSYNLKGSDIDYKLPFAKLAEGTYTLKYTVKSGVTTAESSYTFKVEKPKQQDTQIVEKANVIPASKIYVNQYNSVFKSQRACTLASCGMVLRARAYLSGKDPSSITLKKLWNNGWSSGSGCKYNFSIDGMSISAYGCKVDLKCYSKSQKIKLFKDLLDVHPEGIVVYAWNESCSQEHAVYLSHYVGNTFYVLDPAQSAKYIPINKSEHPELYTDLNNVHQIWVSGKLNIK